MARTYNKATLIGRLGGDPEVTTLPSGMQMCKFSLATNNSFKDKSGEWKEETDWHRIVVWGNLVEQAQRNLKKGSQVCVEGRIKYTQYEKDGKTNNFTDIVASSIVFLDKLEGGGGSYSNSSSNSNSSSGKSFDSNTVSSNFDNEEVPF
jgi:single-strand DNA-binding protein